MKEQWISLLNILLAAALGFVIGFERKLRSKEAGIRTHAIVSVGSALMMAVSKYAFGGEADAARVAAQIVTGIGFLGAGIIVYRKHAVHGLTTAAGIWASAGVGMACGGGLYILAIGASLILILVQVILHLPVKAFKMKKGFMLKIVFEESSDERERVKEMFEIDRFTRLFMKTEGDKILIHATLNTDREFDSAHLARALRTCPFILSVERCDDN
ncbi:MAG: MgtC/SapB family protein [Clostridiales bacterium]|nr:MgtC/SapB family protein [Clostridiales bacterium]